MDLKPFKLDIDELIHEFTESESTTLAEFKRVWLSRKFSFIFEASPSTNQGFAVSASSLSKRLGGLYCLYCLYETQPFKPPFKIYLSLGELRQLRTLALDAKTRDAKVVSALLKSMLERKMFLFGFVGVNEGSATQRVNELTDLQNARVQTAYKRLFANSRLEHFIHMDLGTELDVDLLKKRSSDYAAAKEIAIEESSQVIDVHNIHHITENKRLIGEVMEKTATDWNSEKELFYAQTGISRLPVAIPPEQEDNEHVRRQSCNKNTEQKEPFCDNLDNENNEEPDNFGKDLEVMLFRPLECDSEEEAEPENSEEQDRYVV